MSDFKTLFETFRVSLYEAFALLLPGFMLLVTARAYFPEVDVPSLEGVAPWVVYAITALLAGYVLKGLTAFAADFYRFSLLPFHRRLVKHAKGGREKATMWGWIRAMLTTKPPMFGWIPRWLWFLVTVPFALVQWVYVPWRQLRVGNGPFFKGKSFERVREVVTEMFKVDGMTMEPRHLWTICYGAIAPEPRDKRDRLDATADMLRSLIVLVWASGVIQLARGSWTWSLGLVLLTHYVVGGAFYNRVLRYDTLAERNIFQAFFSQYCRTTAVKAAEDVTSVPEMTDTAGA